MLTKFDITKKVCCPILPLQSFDSTQLLSAAFDNASCNDTQVDHLHRLIPTFKGRNGQVRCFAHILNLAVQAALRALEDHTFMDVNDLDFDSEGEGDGDDFSETESAADNESDCSEARMDAGEVEIDDPAILEHLDDDPDDPTLSVGDGAALSSAEISALRAAAAVLISGLRKVSMHICCIFSC